MHPSWNQYPRLLAELDPNGNKGLTHHGKPIHVLDLMIGTNKRLDWKCITCDHKWKTPPHHRVNGKGCPYCNRGDLHSDGRNSMFMTHPHLAQEYQGDATKIVAGTNKRLDWKCHTCKHEWKAPGGNRVLGRGCPACANYAIHIDGRNSLAITHPELAKEYQGDATKVIAGTNKKLPWKCSICEHEWEAAGCKRSDKNNPRGCPFCSGNSIHSDGRNSKTITHPDHALEYQGDATKIMAGSHQKLLWKCLIISNTPCGYEWVAQCKSRALDGRGCPRCANYGFKLDEPAYYYVHEILNESGDRLYYKAGISGNWEERLKGLQRKLPNHLTMKNLDYLEFENGQDAWDIEKQILKQAEEEGWKAPVRDFDGGTELFLENPIDFLNLRSENGS